MAGPTSIRACLQFKLNKLIVQLSQQSADDATLFPPKQANDGEEVQYEIVCGIHFFDTKGIL